MADRIKNNHAMRNKKRQNRCKTRLNHEGRPSKIHNRSWHSLHTLALSELKDKSKYSQIKDFSWTFVWSFIFLINVKKETTANSEVRKSKRVWAESIKR